MPSPARTGGNCLPMRDLIRMAADGIHYLAVFEDHSDRPIYLGRQKRLATADQRIICYSRDGGCTRPHCLAPGYHSEVHHSPDWAAGGRHQRRPAVLRLRPRPRTRQHRAMADQRSPRPDDWPDQRHPTPRDQPRPPPRGTPPQ